MGKLDVAINKINTYSGVKSIAVKFDNNQRIWFYVKSSLTATSGTLYCVDLSGNILGSVSVNPGTVISRMVAIDNLCCVMKITNNFCNVMVYQLTSSGISLLKISEESLGKYPNYTYYGYTDDAGNRHITFSSNSSRETVVDYDIDNDDVTRYESSSQRVCCLYFYHYGTGSNARYRALMWNSNSSGSTLYNAGFKIESVVASAKTLPGNPVLSNAYFCMMIPLFDFTNSLSDLLYEVFASIYNGTTYSGTCTNVLGLGGNIVTNISRGNISFNDPLSGSSYGLYGLGGITIIDNKEYKIYTYNNSTGNVEAIYTETLPVKTYKLATIKEAAIIGGVNNFTDDNKNKLIIKSELDTYNCKLNSFADTYFDNQCIKLVDLELKNISQSTSTLISGYVDIDLTGLQIDFGNNSQGLEYIYSYDINSQITRSNTITDASKLNIICAQGSGWNPTIIGNGDDVSVWFENIVYESNKFYAKIRYKVLTNSSAYGYIIFNSQSNGAAIALISITQSN